MDVKGKANEADVAKEVDTKGKAKKVDVNANEVIVSVVERNSKSILKKLVLNQKLSEIREELDFNKDKVSFFRKVNDDKFDDIAEKDENKFSLRDVVTVDNENYFLYIKKRSYWNTLNDIRKLDFGRTMNYGGIEVAKERAFIVENCEIDDEIVGGLGEGRIEFSSKED